MSFFSIYSLGMKIIFNICSDIHIGFDKWTKCDAFMSITNIAGFYFMGTMQVEDILDINRKEKYDWVGMVTVVVTWIRLGSYFLVISGFSILLNTIYSMAISGISFTFIVFSNLLIYGSLMMLMFISIDPTNYGTYPYAVRYLFDSMLGNYPQFQYTRRDKEYTLIFMMFLLTSHIFLLNFLIAILSLTFNEMRIHGKFAFLSNRYQYIEKFMMPVRDEFGYQELIIQPSPINVMTLPILFLLPNKRLFKKASFYYSFLIFWIENIFLLFFFFL